MSLAWREEEERRRSGRREGGRGSEGREGKKPREFIIKPATAVEHGSEGIRKQWRMPLLFQGQGIDSRRNPAGRKTTNKNFVLGGLRPERGHGTHIECSRWTTCGNYTH